MKKPIDTYNFTVKNANSETVDIYIDGGIVDAETQEILRDWYGDETSVSFKSFRDQVLDSKATVFNIYINSGGGHVGDAMAIHDLIQGMKRDGKTVNTIGTGIVASAATYPLMAGSVIEMTENSFFMIHNVSGGVYGDVQYVENYARSLRKFNDLARDFYANGTGLPANEVEAMMSAETWMSATEAKEKGFINKISGKAKFSNSIKPEDWQYNNKAILNSYNAQVKNQEQTPNLLDVLEQKFENMKKFLAESFGNKAKSITPAEGATPADIANQVTAVLTTSLEEYETEIGNTVDQAIIDITTQVTNAVTASLEQRLAALETTNGQLKTENEALALSMENMAGGATHKKNEADVKVIGGFSTGD